MKKRSLKKFQIKTYSAVKDDEGNVIETYSDEANEDVALIWPASSKLQTELYGMRVNDMLNMHYYGSLEIKEHDMRAVKQAGGIVQSQAKLLISSDTGALARSVRVKNEVKEDMVSSTVYTNSKYAPYYEFGTGPNGEANHQGISPKVSPKYRQTGWMIPADAMPVDKAEGYGFKIIYKNGDVIGYGTRGQMARPFMYPALHDQEQAIAKNTERLFRKKLREICNK